MDTIQQRIAIAKACGWTQVSRMQQEGLRDDVRGVPPTGTQHEYVPDYVGDLNDISEAMKCVPQDDRDMFSGKLTVIVADENPDWTSFDVENATASQRARAFLETLGLWDDDIPANVIYSHFFVDIQIKRNKRVD